MTHYNWGIVGLGRIAAQFSANFPASQSLTAVAASDLTRAQAFAKAHQVPRAYGSYAELFADPTVDIVYVATTHNFHYRDIKAALLAGKHVLAEKAITLNSTELDELIELAADKQLILMEAQTIYHMPLYPELVAFASTNQLGKLRTIQVSFGSKVPYDPKDRLLNPALAGGALLDIGVYALSFVRRFMTATPKLLATTMVTADTGVDDQSSFLLTNANNEQATVVLNLQAKMPKLGMVAYEGGFFTVDQYPRSQEAQFTAPDLMQQVIEAGQTEQAFQYEIEDMAKAVETGDNPTLAWTQDVMAIMSEAREQWGFKYPEEN